MNKRKLLTLGAALCMLICAFTFKSGTMTKAKDIQQDFVQLNDQLLIDKYEVSNADYRKFISYLKETRQEELYKRCLWDSAKWSVTTGNEPMQTYYHSHKAYADYPVVTVSYEAANEYCKWLTAQYNSDADRKFKKVLFRLPSEQEWTDAATGGDKNKIYPWENYYLRNRKGEFLCNFLHVGDESISYDPQTKSYKILETFTDRNRLLSPVNSFAPSPGGMYNLSGNAAEMVSEKGLAKGGSYHDPGSDVKIASRKFYDGPSPEIGFRVAMEIVEK